MLQYKRRRKVLITIEPFHMTSCPPHTLVTQNNETAAILVIWELNLPLMLKLLLVAINSLSCWPREWKRFIVESLITDHITLSCGICVERQTPQFDLGTRVTCLSELHPASQLFVHFLTKRGEPSKPDQLFPIHSQLSLAQPGQLS